MSYQGSPDPNNFFPLYSELDLELPGVFGDLQRRIEDLFNNVANVPGRILSVIGDKISEAFSWIGQHVTYRLFIYVWDVYRIVEDWTAGWDEPWRSIARVFLFGPAFVYKGFKDYVEPKLRQLRDDVVQAFDGAFTAVGDTIYKIFSPLIDPMRSFFEKVRDFFLVDVPRFFVDVKDFFLGIKDRLGDLYRWLDDKARRFIDTVIDFVTKDIPGFFTDIKDRLGRLGEGIKNFFTKELPEYVKEYLSRIADFLRENIADPVVNALRRFWEAEVEGIRRLLGMASDYYMQLSAVYEREGLEGVFARFIPIMAAGAAVAVAADLLSIKIAGTGIDPQSIRQYLDRTVFRLISPEIFTSVFLAIAVQKPLEYVVRRVFRTERPNPSDALNFLSKNLITEEQALHYLQIAGYPDEIARTYLRSIYREPPFEAVFTAYRRGKIDDREYRVWLSVLNIDRAETLNGTLYPYRVLEEAAYRLPSPFVLTYAVETGEISEDVLRRILEYDLLHPEFIDVMVKGLMWRAARDERSLLRKYVIDSYIDGALSSEQLQHYLGVLGLSGDLTGSLLDAADLARRKSIRRKALSYLEKQFLEGYMDRSDFINQLVSYGFDEELVREYAALLEYVRDNYMVVKETRDERSSLKAALVNKYKRGLLTDEELEAELRKLNLNEIEIALTLSRAKLEFDAEQKEILFNDLIEKMKQGWISKSEFTDQCQRLGIKYERCLAYADYYWTKYIGDQFYVITKDERSALASSIIKKYVMGFMSEDELRDELKKLMYSDEEIQLRIRRAMVEDEVKMLSDLLAEADSLLKRGEITPEDYVEYLVSLGMRRERAEARAAKITASMRRAAK